jgi:putative DNA primase/helicase
MQFIKYVLSSSTHKEIMYNNSKFSNGVLNELYYYMPDMPSKDLDKELLNLANGTLHFNDGKATLMVHDSNDGLDYCLDYNYNLDAPIPDVFANFMSKITVQSQSIETILQEAAASALCHMTLEKIVILFGGGSNGKSVWLKIVQAIYGEKNISNMTLKDLTSGDKAMNNRSQLVYKKLNIATEMNSKGIQDHAMIKTLASREPVSVKLLYADTFTTDRYARLIFACNGLPHDVEHNHGFFRRFLLIPFNCNIPDHEQDTDLLNKIITPSNKSGILNWLIAGYERLCQQRRFSQCKECDQALEEYMQDVDSVAGFMKDECYVPDQYSQGNEFGLLYLDYLRYVEDCGYRPVSKKEFGKRLRSKGFAVKKANQGKTYVYCSKQDAPSEITSTPIPDVNDVNNDDCIPF